MRFNLTKIKWFGIIPLVLILGLLAIRGGYEYFYKFSYTAPSSQKIFYRQIPPGFQSAKEDKPYDIAVIGAGAAGSMAAYRSAINNDKVLLFIGDKQAQKRSRGTWVPEYGNLPALSNIHRPNFYLRFTALEAIINSPFKDNLSLSNRSVKTLKKDQDYFTLTDANGRTYTAKKVILATGMMDIQPQINGSIQPILPFANNQLAIYCIRCDGHLSAGQEHVVIIGYNNSAAQNAILIHERYAPQKMTILTNGVEAQWSEVTQELMNAYGINVYKQSINQLREGPSDNQMTFILEDERSLTSNLAVINLGVVVNNELAKQVGAELDRRGFVITDESGETSVSGLYAIGDLQANTMKQIYTSWDTAIKASEAINRNFRLEKRKEHLDAFRNK